jgi:Kef-type K+ transport system membrane component KefB
VSADAVGLVVLLDVALVLLAGAVVARGIARFGQPAVIGEILAGIALGPSLLGLLVPGAPEALFPDEARPYLKVVATFGLAVFMFGVGQEIDLGRVRRAGRRVAALSTGSMVVPAAAGVLVAIPLWSAHAVVDGDAVPFAAFAAFLAIALAVTAFPVLARIIDEAGLLGTPLGTTALAVAAVTDLVAWSALAVVVGAVADDGGSVPLLVAQAAGFAGALLLVVRPVLRGILARLDRDGRTGAAAGVLLAGVLACAAATGAVGLHEAIGAFAFGLICPRRGPAARPAAAGAETLRGTGLLLIPVFFLTTGLNVDFSGLTLGGVGTMALLLLVACGAKVGGVTGAARLSGMGRRESAAMGVLLNARGLTELVVLEVGRSAGILDETTFTALVGVAIITTVLTGPVFRRLHRPAAEPDPPGRTGTIHPPRGARRAPHGPPEPTRGR